ncbi:tetratricopeptide repeat protein [Sphingopyxis sp.]|jgi:hypothetical protein|uniref:tetratricopeptide repeat protein n=1 Tax=Sphingopyxis sp. TaxID=1908224 RepID=UPI002DEC0B71|nr:tetratricopeptide repeat protein [Sphingopyxis sp.]
MHFFLISIVLQVLCIVHVFRTGRNTAWIMAIAFLPMVGVLAYFIVEILPGLPRDRRVREARTKIADKMDPERRIREARDAAEFSDTAGNRIEYGDALMERGRHAEALAQFRAAERLSPHADRTIGMRIAEAAYEAGQLAEALKAIDALPETISRTEIDRRALLTAKIAEADGRTDDALAIYREIVGRVPGDEIRCRIAGILIGKGDKAGALSVLREVEQRMKRTPPVTLKAEAEMYDWVKRTLAELR